MSNHLTALLLVLGACAPGLLAADAHAGHDHAGHDHGHAGHDHGAATPLGSVGIGEAKIILAAAGVPKAGGEWHVACAVEPASAAPKAIRLWVGLENGRGSTKAKADAIHAGQYQAHVSVPTPLPAESKLWVSLEKADGTQVKASVALPVK